MRILFIVFFGVIFASGCATTKQQPINYSETTLHKDAKIGIAVAPLPDVQITYPGASCLLCLAAAAAANSSLSKHVDSLSADDLKEIPLLIKAKVEELGYDAKIIEAPLELSELPKYSGKLPNTAPRDFSSFKQKYDVDYLIGVELNYVGVQRNYSSYVPVSDPQALISGLQFVVRVEDNTFTWFKPLDFRKGAEGEWKQKPDFPNLTNAYYQVVESTLDEVVNTKRGKINEGEVIDPETGEIAQVDLSKQ
ncbi:hypothetical protein [Agaribacterium haliotis]|uniref:hypothetical protein n=1 Tax=Agaribacterium haliotis TaxID=2013869 RepID=UPI000BB52C41|nr:hypothetical protein [Agaribacterium haliotis]